MPSWIITPIIGLFGFMLAWGEWIEAAVGRRGREVVRMVSTATFLFGAFFAREELIEVFLNAGQKAADVWIKMLQEGVADFGPPPTTTPVTVP